MAHEQLP
ncbi:hypothetical protein PDE_06244 [Penicillium oxalicum 114-2]|nr:hypothetical protein PDE_06244 [Penicillium oxalicum 114-2]